MSEMNPSKKMLHICDDQHLKLFLGQAAAKGIIMPVLLLLSFASEHARTIFTALTGEGMDAPPVKHPAGIEQGQMDVIDRNTAAELLRKHAGSAGKGAANFIEDDVLSVDWWEVCLASKRLHVSGWANGSARVAGSLDYDIVKRLDRPPGAIKNDPGPSMFSFEVFGGKSYRVFGRTGADAWSAAQLVSLIIRYPGFADWPYSMRKGKPIRVTEEYVRHILLKDYGCKPHQVAEAIMCLKRSAPDMARWLQRVLRSAKALRRFERAVKRELTGKEG